METTYGVLPNGEVPTYKNYPREYNCWMAMLGRCSDEQKEKSYYYSIYKEEWSCLANFIQDMKLIENYEIWRDNPNCRIVLDKDIKCPIKSKDCTNKYEKMYCVENCMFVPAIVNSQERNYRPGGSNVPYIVMYKDEELMRLKNNIHFFAFIFHNGLEDKYFDLFELYGQENFTFNDYTFIFDEQEYFNQIQKLIEEEIVNQNLVDRRKDDSE